MYDVNYTQVLAEYRMGERVSGDQSWPTKECSVWEYDLSQVGGYPSIVSEVSNAREVLLNGAKNKTQNYGTFMVS